MAHIAAADVIRAFRATEFVPVARTWDTRIALRGRRGTLDASCGCALVALAAERGRDVAAMIRDADGSSYDLVDALARALGVSHAHAEGIVAGWDWRSDIHAGQTGEWSLGYAAGRAARAELLRSERPEGAA